MVAIGLTSVIGLGVMRIGQQSQSQAVVSKQNIATDDYVRGLRKYLENKNNCNNTLSLSAGKLVADLGAYEAIDKSPLKITETKVLLPNLTNAGREVMPVSIFVYFDRELSGFEKTNPVKKTTANVEFNNGVFIGCSDYEAESEITAFKIACESVGGKFNLTSGVKGSEKCDFTNIDMNHEFLVKGRKHICETVFKGVFDGNKCDSVNMPVATGLSKNLKSDSYQINGKWVKTFNQMCAGDNNFVASVNVDGSVTCKAVQFCTKCDGSCPASGPVCDGAVVPPEPIAIDCDAQDIYKLSGTNNAVNTATCSFEDYTLNAAKNGCSSTINTTSAGICKQFAASTCYGGVAGTIENSPDGTSCGVDKECMSGSCLDSAGPPPIVGDIPKCNDGSTAYTTKATCETANGGKACVSESKWVWNTKVSLGMVDNLDTRSYQLCINMDGKTCSSGDKMRCTKEHRIKGEAEDFSCGTRNYYCANTAVVAGCWMETKDNQDMSEINPAGYPAAKWSCNNSDRPTKNNGNSAGPCQANVSFCEYDYKYGTREFECVEDKGQCVNTPPPSTNPCDGGKCVWKKDFKTEDTCNRSVPKCSELIGNTCDVITDGKQCNDYPLPYGDTKCQINDTIKCELK